MEDDELEKHLAGEMIRNQKFLLAYIHAQTCLRDRIAHAVCNWIMNHIATKYYRDMIDGSIRYGLMAAARDQVNAGERAAAKREADKV